MRGRTLTVRVIALLGAGSAAIHQLRYAIGYGASSSHALAAHGHAYLAVAMPIVMGLALVVLATGLTRIAHGHGDAGLRGSVWKLWLVAAIALAAIYGTQETLEGASAVAGGGWIGLALAIPAGLLIALVLRGADAAEGLALRLPLRFGVRADAAVRTPSTLRRGRTIVTPAGARAPPLPSFV